MSFGDMNRTIKRIGVTEANLDHVAAVRRREP
jgi:hypothetical protein